MDSSTGCLGLSLRTTTIIAGVITFVQSIVWAVIALMAYLVYQCTYEIDSGLPVSIRLTYIVYFLNPDCPVVDVQLHDKSKGVPTAERTSLWSVGYVFMSFLWLVVSLLLLGTLVGRLSGRSGARLFYPWVVVTVSTLIVDLVATGLYASDAASFTDAAAVTNASNVVIPDDWIRGSALAEDGLLLKTGSLIIMAVSIRGVVGWLLNAVLLVHVVRAARCLLAEDTKGDSRRAPPAADPEPTRSRPESRRDAAEPLAPSSAASVATATTNTTNNNTMSSSSSNTVEKEQVAAVPVPLSRSSVKVLPKRPSERVILKHVEPRQASASEQDDALVRLERLSQHRASNRSLDIGHGLGLVQADAREPTMPAVMSSTSAGIEAKIKKIMRTMSNSSPVKPATAAGLKEDRQYQHQSSWEYHDNTFPDDDILDTPSNGISPLAHFQDPIRSQPRLDPWLDPSEVGIGRRTREFEDAPPGRRRREPDRLERTGSDRADGQWRMGHRPPGNLHGLRPLGSMAVTSPGLGRRHYARQADPDHGHTGQDAAGQVKKELPWSYLKPNRTESDLFANRDVRLPPGPPAKVMHSVYLPPAGADTEGEFYRSDRPRRRGDHMARDVLF